MSRDGDRDAPTVHSHPASRRGGGRDRHAERHRGSRHDLEHLPNRDFRCVAEQGTTILFEDTTTGLRNTCSAATAEGGVTKAGHGLSGAGIVTISSNTWGTSTKKCTGPAGVTFTAVGTNTPWKLNAVSYKASVDGGQTTGTITASGSGIGLKITGALLSLPCSMTTGGTKSAPASASFLYDNNSHLLAITSVKNLKLTKSNCPFYNVGNRALFITSPASTAGKAVTRGYSVSSKIHLTSP
jgi:hypothetical protein